MDDDIDIEEHDVLDHPRIRQLLPNLSSIKTEIPDHGFPDDHGNMGYKPYEENEAVTEYQHHSSKIILGSKPDSSLHITETQINGESVLVFGRTIKEEAFDPEDEVTPPDDEELRAPNDTFSPVLILGSKPSSTVNLNAVKDDNDCLDQNNEVFMEIDDAEMWKIKNSIVYLEDWGPLLQDSPCYCKECEILFPTCNTLLAHNTTAHSFLVALETNKAMKSTSKATSKKTDSAKFCNHCNVMFPNPDALINHLYENLQFDANNVVFKSSEASTPTIQKVQDLAKSDLTNEFYCCKVCSYYFKVRDNIATHMTSNHAINPEHLVLEAFNPRCRFCLSKFLSITSYNKHIRFVHKSEFTQVNLNADENFQCLLCNIVVPTYAQARYHRKIYHPEHKNVLIFHKVNSNKITQDKLQPQSSSYTQKLPVAKSVLFQCRQCFINFISCTAANLHAKTCQNVKGDWACHICDRLFNLQDKKKHLLQHQVSSERFNIYLSGDDTLGRILNKCPDCKAYFHENSFTKHCSTTCKGVSVTCTLCELDIHSLSIEEHYKWHDKLNISDQSEFIIVEFAKTDNITIEQPIAELPKPVPAKRKMEEMSNEIAKKMKIEENKALVTVYYCDKCRTFSLYRGKLHSSGLCVKSRRRYICKTCGITHSTNKHKSFHQTYPQLTMMDMQFVSMHNLEPIIPPEPPFPRCKKCKVHFCTDKSVALHDCSDSHKTCKQCNKIFSDLAFRLHLNFHQYESRMNSSSSEKIAKPSETTNGANAVIPRNSVGKRRISPIPFQGQISELIQKYEKLSNVWNILYRCHSCNIIYDSYDKCVEHSQNHLNNMEKHGVIVKYCKICDLKFDSTCFNKHKELHAQNKTICKKSFKIVSYKYTNLSSSLWMNSIKAQLGDVQQIIASSVYLYTRRVKMRVVQDGAPESTLFKCCKCQRYVHPTSVYGHSRKHLPNREIAGRDCKICNIQFSTLTAKAHHIAHHEKFDHFKVVHFNEKGDEEFNDKLCPKNLDNESPSASNKVHYFKCLSCKLCLRRRGAAAGHACRSGARRPRRCERCDLYFDFRSSQWRHQQLHQTNPQFNTKCIMITGFIPKSKSATKRVVFLPTKQWSGKTGSKPDATSEVNRTMLYRCSCGLHFTSESTAEKHIDVCVKGANVTREECSKCGRLFDTTQLVTHLCKHHSADSKTQFTIIQVRPQKTMKRLLHHCKKCDIYYLSSGGLTYHVSTGHQRTKIQTCTHCKLKFMPRTLEKHMLIHHKVRMTTTSQQKLCLTREKKIRPLRNLHLSSSSIFTFKEDYLKAINMQKYSKKLYKCVTCKAHFLTKGTLVWHSKKHFTVLDNCDICQYGFSLATLSKHLYIHHERMKLKREDFIIVTLNGTTETETVCSENKTKELETTEANAAEDDTSGIVTAGNSIVEDDVTDNNYTTANEELSVDESVNRGVNESQSTAGDDSEIMNEDNIENTNSSGYTARIKTRNVLFKCEFCNQHFINEKTVLAHITRIHVNKLRQYQVDTCNICNLTFPSTTYKRHMYLHHEKQQVNKSDLYIIVMKLCNGFITSNHLFRCGTCFLSFSRYESLMDHKNHTLDKVTCLKCGFEFSTLQLSKHIELHHSCVDYKREDFVVLDHTKPNEMSLVSSESLAKYDAGVQPAQPVEKTVKERNYSQDYIIKQVDVSKYTKLLYKCCYCGLHCTHSDTLNKHKKICKTETTSAIDCNLCGLKFGVGSVVKHKYAHHLVMGLKLEDFEIIVSGKDKEKTNKSLDSDSVDRSSTLDTSSITSELLDLPGPSNTSSRVTRALTTWSRSQIDVDCFNNFLYRCNKCSVHFLLRSSLNSHININKKDHCRNVDKVTCSVCGLYFSKISLAKHIYIHHENFKMKREDFHILDATASGLTFLEGSKKTKKESDSNSNILFRCIKCKMNFFKIHSLKDHIPRCDVTFDKTSCHECGLVFSVDTIPKHLREHHDQLGLTVDDFKFLNENSLVIIEPKTTSEKDHAQSDTRLVYEDSVQEMSNNSAISKTASSDTKFLFKCRICGSHYLKHKTISRHILDCKNKGEQINCEQCGLEFHLRSLNKHRKIHHDKMKLTLGDLTVYNEFFEVIKPKDGTSTFNADEPAELTVNIHTLNKSLYTNILYRCNVCQLHFLTEDTLDWHMKNSKHNVRKCQCTTCGLAFSLKSLPTHIFIHHEKLAYTKKDYIVKAVGHSTADNAKPKDTEEKSADGEVESSASQESRDIITANDTAPNEIAANSNLDKDESETAESSNNMIVDADSNAPSTVDTSSQNKKDPDNDLIKLYKCGECNVCYVAQSTCYKHILKHKPLEPEDYIECKMCGYQFLIFKSLHNHISQHHHNKNYNPENVLIEEYHPNVLCHGSPKIQIYRGSDKVQSKQVSTTCDEVKHIDDDDTTAVADASEADDKSDDVSEDKSEDTPTAGTSEDNVEKDVIVGEN